MPTVKKNTYSEKINDKLRRLGLERSFINEVNTLRKKWYIPKKGIVNYHNWLKKLVRNPNISVDGKDYLKIYLQFLAKQDKRTERIGVINSTRRRRVHALLLGDVTLDELNIDVIRLRVKYRLSGQYHRPLWFFVLFDTIGMKLIPVRNFQLRREIDYNEQVHLILEIFAETTIKDIQKSWTSVILPQKTVAFGFELGKRHRKMTKFDRNKVLVDLFDEGIGSIKAITTMYNARYSKLDTTLGADDVRKILHRFKRKSRDT